MLRLGLAVLVVTTTSCCFCSSSLLCFTVVLTGVVKEVVGVVAEVVACVVAVGLVEDLLAVVVAEGLGATGALAISAYDFCGFPLACGRGRG